MKVILIWLAALLPHLNSTVRAQASSDAPSAEATTVTNLRDLVMAFVPAARAVDDLRAPFGERLIHALESHVGKLRLRQWLEDEALRELAHDPSRLAPLIETIGILKIEAARPHLEALLQHASSRVQAMSLEALALLGSEASAQSIERYLRTPTTKVREKFDRRRLEQLVGDSTPEAMALAKRTFAADDPVLRFVALRALGRSRREEAVGTMVSALGHWKQDIRREASRLLASTRRIEAIDALIDFLRERYHVRQLIDARRLLHLHTGKDFGERGELWQRWWKQAKAEFRFQSDLPATADENTKRHGRTRVRPEVSEAPPKSYGQYFGIELLSDRAIFLIDVSNSMLRTMPYFRRQREDAEAPKRKSPLRPPPRVREGVKRRVDVAKAELSRLLRGAPDSLRANVLWFNASFGQWRSQPTRLAGEERRAALEFVGSLQNRAGTHILEPLIYVLRHTDIEQPHGLIDSGGPSPWDERSSSLNLFLLTDGLNGGRRDHGLDSPRTRRFLGAVEAANNRRILPARIHTISVGRASELLRLLAERSGGEYRTLKSYGPHS